MDRHRIVGFTAVGLLIVLAFSQLQLVGANTNTTGGTSTSGAGGASLVYAFPITISSSGAAIQTIGVNWAGTQAGSVMVALYSAGAGKPGTLLTSSVSTAMFTVAGWQDIAVSAYSAAAGSYWLAIELSGAKSVFYTAAQRSYYSKGYGSFDATWAAGSSGDSLAQWNMRITYTTGPPPADYSIASVPTSNSVGAGSTASYTINLAAGGGYSGSVTLSLDAGTPCPLGATCTFTPATPIALSTTGSATFSVQTVLGGYTGTTSLQIDASDGGSHNHQVTVSLTVTAPANFQFNVKGTATQVVVTLMYSSSSAPPAASLTIAGPLGSPTLAETAGTVYDRTSITVTSGTPTYNVIHRVTWTVSAPGSAQVWTVYVSLSGASSYTVTIEVS